VFLGQETEDGTVVDPGLGFDRPDWIVDVISAVGNYEEIYNRHVGPDTPLGLERGVNALWTEGGVLYAPPYR
jgi:general L-amino acid transport system substrate-binding protein